MRPGTIATRGVLAEVLLERVRQDAKFGSDRDHPSIDPRFAYMPELVACAHGFPVEAVAKQACEAAFREGRGTWTHIAIEEISEAICADDDTARRAELVQVAAVAVAWIEAIDRRAGMEACAPPAPQSPGQGGAAAYMADGHIELGCGSLPSLAILDERPAAPESATHWHMIHPSHAALNKTINNAALACRMVGEGYAAEAVAP